MMSLVNSTDKTITISNNGSMNGTSSTVKMSTTWIIQITWPTNTSNTSNMTISNETYPFPTPPPLPSQPDILFQVDIWLTVTLSIISFVSLSIFLICYLVARVKARDHVKENRKKALKKVFRNEYLIISYCLTLILSHVVTIVQQVIIFRSIENRGEGSSSTTSLTAGCLTTAVLKQFFWLLSMFHCSAISMKLYRKLAKNLNNNLEKKDRRKSIAKTLIYVFSFSGLIVLVSLICNFAINNVMVYQLDVSDRFNFCFLKKPIFLVVFFALPILLILIANFVIFLILFIKTKSAMEQAEIEDKKNLFLKLAVLMGLSWIVYIIAVLIIELAQNLLFVQITVILASFQINLQGFYLTLVLFSNATYEKLFKKKSKSANKNNNNANNNNNNNNNNVNNNNNNDVNHNNNNEQVKPPIEQNRLTVL